MVALEEKVQELEGARESVKEEIKAEEKSQSVEVPAVVVPETAVVVPETAVVVPETAVVYQGDVERFGLKHPEPPPKGAQPPF